MGQTKWTAGFIAKCALIAALYIALTGLFAPFGFAAVQVRISEALCVLALFTPAAIFGLTTGCLISNLLWSTLGILDVLFGTVATFLSVVCIYQLRRQNFFFAMAPDILFNAFLVSLTLMLVAKEAYWLSVFCVGVGQAIACYALGYPLYRLLDRYKEKLPL